MQVLGLYLSRATRVLFYADLATLSFFGICYTLFFSPYPSDNPYGFSSLTDAFVLSVAYGLIVMSTNFAMGLYQRRYMRGDLLWRCLLISGVLSLTLWLALDNLILGNRTSILLIFGAHAFIFALMGLMRPIVSLYFSSSKKKRQFAIVGTTADFSAATFVLKRAEPADFELLPVKTLEHSGPTKQEHLLQTVRSLRENQTLDGVFVGVNASDFKATFSGLSSFDPRLLSASTFYERYARWTELDLLDAEDFTRLPLQGKRWFWVKRAVDTAVTVVLFVFVLPMMLLAAAAIKLDDGGALFYRQTRVGKDGKLFSVLKFRSMVENAEQSGGATWAQVGDSRITRVGAFLRKTRIDELPQLINIIRGDMALVGPRPERPEFVKTLCAEIPGYNQRHLIRPGLTGWAQISYPYGASVEDARWKTKFDLYYIKNWTIWLDIAIVLQTIRVVLLAEGAR